MTYQVVNDRYWRQVADFLSSHPECGRMVYAESEFQLLGIKVEGYCDGCSQNTKDAVFVVHKGRELDSDFVHILISEYYPVFANEVFVVFSGNQALKREDSSVHFRAFLKKYIRTKTEAVNMVRKSEERPMLYLGGFRALTKTIYGHKIVVDTRDLSLAPHILIDGYWESWISKVFLDLVKPGMNVLDIGANVGFYSLLAAEKIGASGRLTCFEANPEMADLVFQNMQINGFSDRSTVIDKAVYSENGPLTFNIYQKFLGSSSLWADDAHAGNFRDSIKKITVDGVTLDSYFPPGTRVDFVKIDAEGAEPFILKGANRLLQDNPQLVVMMEFAPAIISVAYGSVESFYDEVRSSGFCIFKIEHNSSLREIHRPDVLATGHCDVVLKR